MNSLQLSLRSGSNVPVQQLRDIHPLGKYAGLETTNFSNFQPGAPDESVFEFEGKESCPPGTPTQCPDGQGDGDDGVRGDLPPLSPLYRALMSS